MFRAVGTVVLSASRRQMMRSSRSRFLLQRGYQSSAALCLEVPSLSGFFSSENDKADNIAKEVSKKQIFDDEDEDEMEEMFIMGPSQGKIEWGGPTRGGIRPEPTRFGDWERKGRVTDF